MSGQQSNKIEVLWSPNKDEDLATYSTELKLYTVRELEGDGASVPSPGLKLSLRRYGHLINSPNSDIHCMPVHQCVAWQPSSIQPYFFAVGHSSGKALLANLGLDHNSTTPTMKQVLGPRSGRPCTCLAWNPSESRLLAEGLEKARSDSSLIVWDVTRASSETALTPERPRFRDQSTSSEDSAKYFEIGHAEATSAVAWFPNQSNCLVAGMGTRFLRIFDIRDEHLAAQTHPREVANHKAIFGLCVDPTSPHQLATYADGGSVYVWDTRQFARPVSPWATIPFGRWPRSQSLRSRNILQPLVSVSKSLEHLETAILNPLKSYSFTRTGSVLRLAWMPTRPSCLSVLLSDAPYLHLIDLPSFTQSLDVQVDTAELYIEHLTSLCDRCPYFTSKSEPLPRLTGVAWHSKWENIGLTANSDGVVKELQVFDKMPLSWTANEHLMYGSSKKLFAAAAANTTEVQNKDISTMMKERVKLGYGFDPATNAELLQDHQLLHKVWAWLKLHQQLTGKGLLPTDKTKKSLWGVYAVLEANKPVAESEATKITKRVSWHEKEGILASELPPFPSFTSPLRQTALLLCGWSFVAEGHTLEDYLKREEMNENYERAAAIAVFQGHVRRGIVSLKDGAGTAAQRGNAARASLLNLIALALSGYTPQETRLWHETCSTVKTQIRSPYLRAAFNFLCSTGRDGFSVVLNETEMLLQDRVAFACTYLDDGQLQAYISNLTRSVVNGGHIDGLFLTGLTTEGIVLLTNYVNQTGDVQTACLIAGQVMQFAIKEKHVQAWFQGYRDLLDQWKMWHERALFDGQRKRLDPSFKPSRQAFVMCSFCSKSISSDSLRQDRRSAYSSGAARKATSCPSCRKPLPRCSLCLLNMVAMGSKPKDTGGRVSSDQFGQWFTWCQSCRHGGHAHHIAEWFTDHQECPVTGCLCRCFSLDTLEKLKP